MARFLVQQDFNQGAMRFEVCESACGSHSGCCKGADEMMSQICLGYKRACPGLPRENGMELENGNSSLVTYDCLSLLSERASERIIVSRPGYSCKAVVVDNLSTT